MPPKFLRIARTIATIFGNDTPKNPNPLGMATTSPRLNSLVHRGSVSE